MVNPRPGRSTLALAASLLTASLCAPAWPAAPGLPATEQVKVFDASSIGRNQLVIRPDNPQIMYWAVASLGVLKSTDGGFTWTPKNDGLPNLATRSLAMHPADPDHLMVGFDGHYAAQGDHPYRSLDGGERWEPTVVCERSDGLENLRQQCSAEKVLFDPTEPNRFYYLVHSQFLSCGGFYRSCDLGASYDRNPRCIAAPDPRSPCAASEPEPANNIASNDASILEVHRTTGWLFGTTGVHPEESGLMTSRDKGASWTWEDVLDTRGTFADPPNQGVTGLFVYAAALAPSDQEVRYAGIFPYFARCPDGKAYNQAGLCPGGSLLMQPNVVARWFGEMSGSADCEGQNDCDGDATPDRVWRPIFAGAPPSNIYWFNHLLVHPTDPNRVFVTGSGSPSELWMLTPAVPADPSVIPWNATLLYSEPEYFGDLVQDPTNPDRFYLIVGGKIHRFESSDGGQTWNRTTITNLSQFHHVYDLLDTRGSDGHRIVAASTNGLTTFDELGTLKYTNAGIQAMAPAVSPSDPDRVFVKRSWALQIGTGGFDSAVDMDNVHHRREVMCTNMFHDVAVDPDDPAVVYAATGAGIWKHPDAHVPVDTSDQELTSRAWQPLGRKANGLEDEYAWSLAFDPADPTHDSLLAGTRGGAIFESRDRGATWSGAAMTLPPGLPEPLRDVKDFAFQGTRAYAATRAGLLARPDSGAPWTLAFSGDRLERIAIGATGSRRLYAAGAAGLQRSRDRGLSWETLPLVPGAPYSAVLETTGRDGRHHLWVPDWRAGLYRVSTTMTARSGPSADVVVLEWTEPAGGSIAGYRLFYGRDPDTLDGADAAEGPSPIPIGPLTTATLTGLDLQSGPVFVALQGVGSGGETGPVGLPLEVDFGFVFSPRAAASTLGPSCPPTIRLTWTPIPGAIGYSIYRSSSGPDGLFTLLAPMAGGTTQYDDTDLANATTYSYYMTSLLEASETSGGPIVGATADFDFDNDGVADCVDNCPPGRNSNQADADGDGIGDACEDPDGDGLETYRDNCASISNPGQEDADVDRVGDVCDNCPTIRNATQFDTDQDGRGNACDNCIAIANADQSDVDADGKGDVCDNCPAVSNSGQMNADGDARGDACDCAPGDPTAFAVPPEVVQLLFTDDQATLVWDSGAAQAGTGTIYDVLRGIVLHLPVGSDGSESCLEPGSPDTSTSDSSLPLVGEAFWYLVRGRNVCGTGTYGLQSDGGERLSAACP